MNSPLPPPKSEVKKRPIDLSGGSGELKKKKKVGKKNKLRAEHIVALIHSHNPFGFSVLIFFFISELPKVFRIFFFFCSGIGINPKSIKKKVDRAKISAVLYTSVVNWSGNYKNICAYLSRCRVGMTFAPDAAFLGL